MSERFFRYDATELRAMGARLSLLARAFARAAERSGPALWSALPVPGVQ